MRSFVALMTCIGCIAWIHSCEKRLLGVQPEKNNIIPNQVQPLPVTILPAAIPAHYISRGGKTTAIMVPPTPATRITNKHRIKKQAVVSDQDSLLFNLAVVRGQYPVSSNITP